SHWSGAFYLGARDTVPGQGAVCRHNLVVIGGVFSDGCIDIRGHIGRGGEYGCWIGGAAASRTTQDFETGLACCPVGPANCNLCRAVCRGRDVVRFKNGGDGAFRETRRTPAAGCGLVGGDPVVIGGSWRCSRVVVRAGTAGKRRGNRRIRSSVEAPVHVIAAQIGIAVGPGQVYLRFGRSCRSEHGNGRG